MRIAVSAQESSLDAPVSAVFGRCPVFIIVDTDTMQFEAVPNPAISLGGGAGIQAAQWVANSGVQAVLTGNLGPNAFAVLQAAGISACLVVEGTVHQAVEAFQIGQLQTMGQASVADHAGLNPQTVPAARTVEPAGRERKLAALRDRLKRLRQELAETLTQIEQLEKER